MSRRELIRSSISPCSPNPESPSRICLSHQCLKESIQSNVPDKHLMTALITKQSVLKHEHSKKKINPFWNIFFLKDQNCVWGHVHPLGPGLHKWMNLASIYNFITKQPSTPLNTGKPPQAQAPILTAPSNPPPFPMTSSLEHASSSRDQSSQYLFLGHWLPCLANQCGRSSGQGRLHTLPRGGQGSGVGEGRRQPQEATGSPPRPRIQGSVWVWTRRRHHTASIVMNY